MWSLSSPSRKWNNKEAIVPTRVLYEYDGPMIFTAQLGFIDAIFLKFDELDNTDLYIATQTNDQIVSMIIAGQLSVRAGLEKDSVWIIEMHRDMTISKYWFCDRERLPDSLLPRKNSGLFPHFGFVPNTLEQAKAFFSVDYQGSQLKKSGMRFSTFKRLVDGTHDAARSILSPIDLFGSKTVTFDFNIAEPVFGSLVLSIQNPTVNERILKQKLAQDVDLNDVRQQFATQRDSFFDEINEVVKSAEKGPVSDALVGERFILLDRIQALIPNEENELRSVMFSASGSNRFSHVLIGEQVGERLSIALRAADSRIIEEYGKVEVTNDPSRSFVMMSQRGKQVTCYVSYDDYDTLKRDVRFRNGANIKARGRLTRRTRRDILHAEGMPTLV